MYLKLYLSEQEKKHLESIAESRGISLSRLCYGQIVPLLSDPLEIPIPAGAFATAKLC